MEIVTINLVRRDEETGELVECLDAVTDGEKAWLKAEDGSGKLVPAKPPYTVTARISVSNTVISYSWRVDG